MTEEQKKILNDFDYKMKDVVYAYSSFIALVHEFVSAEDFDLLNSSFYEFIKFSSEIKKIFSSSISQN